MMLSVIALCAMFGVIGCLLDNKIRELERRVSDLEQTVKFINWNDEVDKDEVGAE